jgi:hypothetical protein
MSWNNKEENVMVICSLEVDFCSNGSIWLCHCYSILMQSILSQPNFLRSCLLSTSNRLAQSSNRLLDNLVAYCRVDTTIRTQLQDDSKTPPDKTSLLGKIYLSKCKMIPQKIKYLLKRNLQLILCTWDMKNVTVYLPLPISATVSIFTVSVFVFPTLNPNVPVLFTAMPQHQSHLLRWTRSTC